MTQQQTRVQVTILDKEYQVACPMEEKEALLLAAHELDKRMRQVRNSGAMVGADRIAVMVALNLCHELQQCLQRPTEPSGQTEAAMQRWSEKLTKALSD